MEIDKIKNTPNDGEVKKKKYSVVFRAGNSQQNSLKTRPQQPAARPGTRPAPATGAARPAAPKAPASKPAPAAPEKKTV